MIHQAFGRAKTGLATLVIAIFSSSCALGQNRQADERFRVGFKGGVQFTNLYAQEVNDENARFGFQAGVLLRTPVSAIFSVQPELLYSQKGAKLNYTAVVNGNRGNQINLHYLELPVLLRLSPTQTFSVHTGPYGAFLLDARLSKEDDADGGISGNETGVDADNFQRFDYGASAGLEFNLRHLDIGARYNLGLRKVSNASALSNQLARNAKNNALQFYVAFVL